VNLKNWGELHVDDPKQLDLHAYYAKMCMMNSMCYSSGYLSSYWYIGISGLM